MLLPAGVVALGLAGLPLTGGALAKVAVKPVLGEGVIGAFASLAAAGSTLLMLHFLRRLAAATGSAGTARPGQTWPWLTTALAAIAVPWVLYPLAQSGPRSSALSSGVLWGALWPVLLGGMVAAGLWGSRIRLPQIPAGDVVVPGERATRSMALCTSIIEHVDDRLREWPVACLSLLLVVFLLAAALWASP